MFVVIVSETTKHTACGNKLFFSLFVFELIDLYLFPEGGGEDEYCPG